MLHFLLNLCAFCRPCPAPAPAPAQTAPARPAGETDSRHGTRAASPAPCRRRRTTRTAPRPDGHAARRPYAASLPAQIKQTEPAGEREDIRRGRRRARREKGRKDEDLRPLACRFAVKVIYRPNPALNGQPSTTPGQQAPQPAPAEAPSLPTYSRPFLSLLILLLESLQNPGPFSPVSRRTTAPRPPAWTPPAPGGGLHIFAPAPFLTKRLSTSTLSRTPHIPIFHSGTISTIPQQ